MYEVDVKIVGVSPLLQHRFKGKEEPEPQPTPQSGEVDYSKEYLSSLYQNENGEIYQPSSHIEGSLVKAASDFKIKGKRGKTYKDLVKASVVIEPFAIPHLIQKYEVDEQRVRVQRAAVMRCRPRFDRWELEFKICVNNDQIPLDVLECILEHAGKFVGIGDFRPKYGRFRIEKFKKAA